MKKFSDEVCEKLGYYVYRLIDPRDGHTFYVGYGQRNRVFDHAKVKAADIILEKDEKPKIRRILEIKASGLEVQYVIHRHGLNKRTAQEIEASLMDAYPGLDNVQGGIGHGRGAMHPGEIIRNYGSPVAQFKHNMLLVSISRSLGKRTGDIYEAARYRWGVSLARVKKCKYILAVKHGLIVEVFVASDWMELTPENFPNIPANEWVDGYYGFKGTVAPKEAQELYRDRRVPDRYLGRGFQKGFRYVP